MRARTNGVGIAAAVVAVALSLLSALNRVLTGRTSEALPQLCVFAVMSVALAYLIYRRRAGTARTTYGKRIKAQAVMLVSFFILLGVGLFVFAVAEVIGNHAYGWLLLIPFALWTLRIQIVGMGKVLRANPDEVMGLRSGDGNP